MFVVFKSQGFDGEKRVVDIRFCGGGKIVVGQTVLNSAFVVRKIVCKGGVYFSCHHHILDRLFSWRNLPRGAINDILC